MTVLRNCLEYEVTISRGISWMAVLYFSVTIFNSNNVQIDIELVETLKVVGVGNLPGEYDGRKLGKGVCGCVFGSDHNEGCGIQVV